MDYQAHFAQALAKLRDERRYRVWIAGIQPPLRLEGVFV
jgi:hypothetical protein